MLSAKPWCLLIRAYACPSQVLDATAATAAGPMKIYMLSLLVILFVVVVVVTGRVAVGHHPSPIRRRLFERPLVFTLECSFLFSELLSITLDLLCSKSRPPT